MSTFSSSPTLFYPIPPPQPFYNSHASQIIQSPTSSWTPVHNKRPSLTANPTRKRSRDTFDEPSPSPPPAASMEVEPVYGEGMTLIDPATGRPMSSAESQTGTWFEENAEMERLANEKAARELEQDRIDALGRPNKSVRLESPMPMDAPIAQPIATAAAAAATSNPSMPAVVGMATTAVSTPQPVVDAATLSLGVGWKAIDIEDADMQGAARGWARYVENHYPALGEVEIVCRSEGQGAFLVKANRPQEAWWLFREDLSEGRLVSGSFQGCVAGLTRVPMVFDAVESVFAATTPAATPSAMESSGADEIMVM